MVNKKRESSIDQRSFIIKLQNEGYSMSKISELVGVSKSTVFYTLKKLKNTGTVQNLARKGRPSKLSQRNTNFIDRSIKNDRFTSSRKLANKLYNCTGVQVSKDTVIRAAKKLGFKSGAPRKVPFIRPQNIIKRLAYAKQHINKPLAFWNSVLFSDESKYNVKKSDGRVRVWRKSGEEYSSNCTLKTFKHGDKSVMVWGVMSAAGVGKLVFIEGIMFKEHYLNIIKQNVVQSARKLGIRNNFTFMHDSDPKHTAKIVKGYIDSKKWNLLNHPPQSPDLNVIEHLWDEVDRQIDRTVVINVGSLKKEIIRVWESITPDVTKKLVESMPRRLQAVLDAKGGSTRY